MLSDSWLKDMHPCLVFVIVHIKDKCSLRRRLVMIKTKNDDQDVQVEDSSEESDVPYLNTIVYYPCRVISSLHFCHTVPYLINIVRYSCRSCCYHHSCYTGPYIIVIVHYPCRVSNILHSCHTVPYLITIIQYTSGVCYYLYSCCPLHYLVCFC